MNKLGKDKVILFDLDGTLIDSTDAILHCFFKSFKESRYKLPNKEEIKSLIGYPLDVMYHKLGIDEKEIWDFVDRYKQCYRKISTSMTTLLPSAIESLELASKYARLGIVTTKTARYSKILLEYMNVMKYFEVLIGREDVTNPKPHHEPIIKALNFMNTPYHKDIYMIGDTILDLQSAKNANIKGIGVLSGYGKEEELKQYTNLIARDAYEGVKLSI